MCVLFIVFLQHLSLVFLRLPFDVLDIFGYPTMNIHRVSKKRPTFTTCYNFYIHSSIATIFGVNVAEKVGN